jgi:hypothetical protein
MNKTALIIGDSPFLGEVEGFIHYAVDKYPSIGINNSIRRYNVSSHIFQDMKFVELTNSYPTIKTITLATYGDLICKDNKEFYNSYVFDFKKDTELYKDEKLAWCGFTHDYAISYCIHKGYENIVLIGAADFTGFAHYLTKEEFNYSEKLKMLSKRFIEEVCSSKAKIYTCNPSSILDIPKIQVSELLEADFQNS